MIHGKENLNSSIHEASASFRLDLYRAVINFGILRYEIKLYGFPEIRKPETENILIN